MVIPSDYVGGAQDDGVGVWDNGGGLLRLAKEVHLDQAATMGNGGSLGP
jgi:hypothetical protein